MSTRIALSISINVLFFTLCFFFLSYDLVTISVGAGTTLHWVSIVLAVWAATGFILDLGRSLNELASLPSEHYLATAYLRNKR